MKKILLMLALFLLGIAAVSAQESHAEIEEGKKLVESKISCNKLSNEQLEAIGDYYMEQMHPGKAHELMDKMMGGEGSESLKQVHINMARRLYCNENYVGYGMMSSGGMMNMMGNNPIGYGYWSFWNVLWLLLWIGIIVLIIWLIYKFIIKREGISETPMGILEKRYAKGEITKKQFEEMKKGISRGK